MYVTIHTLSGVKSDDGATITSDVRHFDKSHGLHPYTVVSFTITDHAGARDTVEMYVKDVNLEQTEHALRAAADELWSMRVLHKAMIEAEADDASVSDNVQGIAQ